MNKYSTRQLFFLLACIMPVGKMVFLPAHLTETAKNDLLFSAALNFAVQAGVIFLVLLLAKRQRTFYELLEYSFGKVVAKILITVFALFLFYAALLPLLEQKVFVQSIFYDTIPSVLAFSPFFLLSTYLCSKRLNSYGRMWDILGPLAITGFAGIFVFSVGSADMGALLPVGASGMGGVFGGMAYSMSWFYDSAILLTLIGKFEYKKGTAWKGLLCYLAGGAAVLILLAIFYGIFAETAVGQLFAISHVSKYFAAITALGRIDYVFIFLLALVMAFWCTLPLQAGIDCIEQAYATGKYLPTIYSIVVNAVMLALTIVLDFSFGAVIDVVAKKLLWIFPVFCVAVPLLALLLRRSPRERIS